MSNRNVSIVVFVFAGVTSNLILPELISALNENNDAFENTSRIEQNTHSNHH